jgi:hypothetical protein
MVSILLVSTVAAWAAVIVVGLSSLASTWSLCTVVVAGHHNLTNGLICTAVHELSHMPMTVSECESKRLAALAGVSGCMHNVYFESFVGVISRFVDSQPLDGYTTRIIIIGLCFLVLPYTLVSIVIAFFKSRVEIRRLTIEEEKNRYSMAQVTDSRNMAMQFMEAMEKARVTQGPEPKVD